MLTKITSSPHLVPVVQDKHLILLAQHSCSEFPPSVKSSPLGVLMLFVIMGNFVIFFVYLNKCCAKIE